MKTILIYCCLITDLVMLDACKNDNNTETCTYPRQLTAGPTCTLGTGLVLTASGYGGTPGPVLQWTIFAVKDSTSAKSVDISDKNMKININATDKFIVPDSLLIKYPKLAVTVSNNCQGTQLHSVYFVFLKTKVASGNCFIWSPVSL